MSGRERLADWKRLHHNRDRFGDERWCCMECERNWPCAVARLVAAVEEALRWDTNPTHNACVLSKLENR